MCQLWGFMLSSLFGLIWFFSLSQQCPTTVVPFFGDQPFWGERVHARGVGPVPIPVDDFSLEKLVDAIRFMLDPKVFRRSNFTSLRIRSICLFSLSGFLSNLSKVFLYSPYGQSNSLLIVPFWLWCLQKCPAVPVHGPTCPILGSKCQ